MHPRVQFPRCEKPGRCLSTEGDAGFGAQGGHKLARGYAPVQTWSAHHIVHPGFREAIADFLEKERAGVASEQLWLDQRTPFRKDQP